jgi:multisubunit Na+/H+ antiporter MnhB subunit
VEVVAVIVLLLATGFVAMRTRSDRAHRIRVVGTRRQTLRRLAPAIAVAALATWVYGVYLLAQGTTERGLVIAAIGAWVLLLLGWARGAWWLPDGSGMP